MAVTINASTSAGLVQSADTTGNLNIQSNGSTVVAVTSAGAAVTGTLSSTGDGSISGRLGVGAAASGTYPLNLVQNDNDFIRFLASNSRVWRLGATGASAGAGTFSLIDDSAGATRISVNANGSMSLANSLGYSIYLSSTSSNNMGIQFLSTADNNGADAQLMDFLCNTNRRFAVDSNGGIRNYSANNVNLSDEREKKSIKLAPNYLDKICAIPVKTFLFNDQTDDLLNLGVIAQDVQAVAPELVAESNWGTKDAPKMRLSIYQTDFQYALMKCIQEQTEQIKTLTDRIAALESKQ